MHRSGLVRHGLMTGAAVAAASMGFSAPAFAQSGPGPAAGALEEVVVTARRREERLQDAPVAVTALSERALEARGVEGVAEIAKFAPNVRFDNAAQLSGGGYNATVFIRGVGQNDFALFSDPGVGVYVDGVYFARSIGAMLDAFDVERIEVLRGPQGTLFGKNTIGGAVLITSKAPEPEFGGKAEVIAGSYDRIDAKATLNLPITEGLSARLSLATLNRDGYVDRLLAGDDLGDRNTDAARLNIRWQASDAVQLNLAYDYTRSRENSAANTLLVVGNRPGFAGVPFLANFNRDVASRLPITAPNGQRSLNPSFITGDPFSTFGTGPNFNDLDLWGVSATLDWELSEGISFKSITAYRHLKAQFARDGDNSPYTFRHTFNYDKQDQFSQEFQLNGESFGGRLTWVAGAYYFKEEGTDQGYAHLALGLSPPIATTPPFSPSVNIFTAVESETYAAFAQGSFALTDQLSVTLGGRYNKDQKEYFLDHRRIFDGLIIANVTRNGEWESFTPKLGLEYKASDDILLYVSAGKGFKSGGFNARPLSDATEVTEYDPETIWTYEAGAKTSWLDQRLVLNAAVFFSKYEDIQLTVNQTPRNFVANAAEAEISGAEVELFARPAPGWDLNLAVGRLHNEYTEIGSGLGPTQVLPINLNSKLVKAPRWTANAGAQYRMVLGELGAVIFRGDVAHFSRVFHDIANDPDLAQDAYTLVSARVSFESPDGAWRASVFGENLTDEEYKVSANASSAAFGLKEAAFGIPRTWGVSLARRF